VPVGDGVTDGSDGVGDVVGNGVTVEVAVAVGVGLWGVVVAVAVGVGLSQIIWTVSILQLSPELLELLAIRHRSTIVCPANGMSTQRFC
jgi:hypothetical protein